MNKNPSGTTVRDFGNLFMHTVVMQRVQLSTPSFVLLKLALFACLSFLITADSSFASVSKSMDDQFTLCGVSISILNTHLSNSRRLKIFVRIAEL